MWKKNWSGFFSQTVILLEVHSLWPGARRMCVCADAICNEQRRRWRVFYFETRYINVSLMLSDIAWKAKSFVNKRFVRRKLHSLFYTLNLRRCLRSLLWNLIIRSRIVFDVHIQLDEKPEIQLCDLLFKSVVRRCCFWQKKSLPHIYIEIGISWNT